MLNIFMDGVMLAVYLPVHWLFGASLPEVPLPVTGYQHFFFGSGLLFAVWLMWRLPGIVAGVIGVILGIVLAAFYGAMGTLTGADGNLRSVPDDWKHLNNWQRAFHGMMHGVEGFMDAYMPQLLKRQHLSR